MLHFTYFTVQRRESRFILCIHSFRSPLALVSGFVGVVYHAQETWQVWPSGVTNNLRSIVYVANQWVAVGEQGTIVTLSAGLSWTRRTMGTGIDAVADANVDAR